MTRPCVAAARGLAILAWAPVLRCLRARDPAAADRLVARSVMTGLGQSLLGLGRKRAD